MVTTEACTTFRNIQLVGSTSLVAEKVTTTTEVNQKIDLETKNPIKGQTTRKRLKTVVKTVTFKLREVNLKELASYRNSEVPSFVLKTNGKIYYARIPKDISFLSSKILGMHQCANAGHECAHLSAASDDNGGCEKVRRLSQRIEDYPWISEGYETFNTKIDSFVVTQCSHYERCHREKVSIAYENKLKLAIAQYQWPDVETLDDVRERVKNNSYHSYYSETK